MSHEKLYRYRVQFSVNGAVGKAEAVDSRAPGEMQRVWIKSILALAKSQRAYEHEMQLANMKNTRVGKQAEEGLEQPEIEDVTPPPAETFDAERMIFFEGFENVETLSVLGNTVLAIECMGEEEVMLIRLTPTERR